MRKRRRFYEMVPPRVLSECETAHYLGRCETTFQSQKDSLERQGFPKIDPLTGGRDLHAIDAWLDRRSGLDQTKISDVSTMIRGRLEGLKGGKGKNSPLLG
jgi:hypothetical protein